MQLLQAQFLKPDIVTGRGYRQQHKHVMDDTMFQAEFLGHASKQQLYHGLRFLHVLMSSDAGAVLIRSNSTSEHGSMTRLRRSKVVWQVSPAPAC